MKNNYSERMNTLMKPIEVQMMLLEDADDELLLACGLVSKGLQIISSHVGIDGAEDLIRDIITKAKDI